MKRIETVTVVGAGTMGRQISLQIARHHIPVVLVDIDDSVLKNAALNQEQIVADWIAAGDEAEDARTTVLGNIRYETDLAVALRDADLAIEAVPEKLELKRQVFKRVDGLLREHAIIASNSSSIRVSFWKTLRSARSKWRISTFICPFGKARWWKLAAAVARGLMCWTRCARSRARSAFCHCQ